MIDSLDILRQSDPQANREVMTTSRTNTASDTTNTSRLSLGAYTHLQSHEHLGKHFTLVRGYSAMTHGEGLGTTDVSSCTYDPVGQISIT
jgi:hypothetical protein